MQFDSLQGFFVIFFKGIKLVTQLDDFLSPCKCIAPIYNTELSYKENFLQGPSFTGNYPERPELCFADTIDFLGFPVQSRIGVPAGPLLSSEWTTLAARLGFDILTYKTIRSKQHPGHPLPNILYVQDREVSSTVTVANHPPENIEHLSITNSFGMPSQSPSFLEQDIPKAVKNLQKNQALVVSITGSAEERLLAEDFVKAAQLAIQCQAPIVEANFSCPNVKGSEGALFMHPKNAAKVASAIKKAIGTVPLIIKLGFIPEQAALQDLLLALSDAGVQAVSGINTVAANVVGRNQSPALGETRPTSGICGAAIFAKALAFIQAAKEVIEQQKLALTLIGVGGAMCAEQLQQFLYHGADFAQTATAMMWDPYLAARFHQQYGINHANNS